MTHKSDTGELEFTKSTKWVLWGAGGILSAFVTFILALLMAINSTTQDLSRDIRGQYQIIHEQRYEMRMLKMKIEKEVIPSIENLRTDFDEMEDER